MGSLKKVMGVIALCDLIFLSTLSAQVTDFQRLGSQPSGYHRLPAQRSLLPVREIRITNGQQIQRGQYPFLTAVLSARYATVEFNGNFAAAYYFGAGVLSDFSGSVVDCGLAMAPCAGVSNRICSIVLDFPGNNRSVLSPAQQLGHCRDGGGTGAVFRPNSQNYIDRMDLAEGGAVDDPANIPAVYVHDRIGNLRLMAALGGGELYATVVRQISDRILCGGSYIGGGWILTAAHCVYEQNQYGHRLLDAQELMVNAGAHHLGEDRSFAQQVVDIRVGDYREIGPWAENDYALLRVNSDPPRGAPIKFVSRTDLDRQTASSASAIVLGWGRTKVREPLVAVDPFEPTSAVPQAAMLGLIPVTACQHLWQKFFQRNGINSGGLNIRNIYLCAANAETREDTCQGDSGGPILLDVDGEIQLAGITNFGLGCGSKNSVPGVYASAPSFKNWVYLQTGLSEIGKELLADGNQQESDSVQQIGSASGAGSISVSQIALLLVLAVVARWPGLSKAIVCLPVVLISACAGDGTSGNHSELNPERASAALDRLERMDVSFGNDLVFLTVASHGCTKAQHFAVNQGMDSAGHCKVGITRQVPDLCKRASHAVTINVPWPGAHECSNRHLVVQNPSLTDD